MAKSVLKIETDAVAVDGARGRGLPSRHPITVAAYEAAPVAGTTKLRFGTSRPALSCSTVSHDPRVNLNSIRPRTELGSVMANRPSARAARRYSGAAGVHWLNGPATKTGAPARAWGAQPKEPPGPKSTRLNPTH